jgi:hypothetical protein
MNEDRADHLPSALDNAVQLLRKEEPVSTDWRDRVLRAVAEDDMAEAVEAPRRRLVPLRAAVAAAIVCAIGGSAATIGVMRRTRPAASAVATSPSQSGTPTALLPVHFSVVAPAAASVSIVGDFNRWSPTALPMKRSADGRTWEIDVKLPQGRYNYTYLIDGRIARDPSAPQTGGGGDDFGMPNSVLMVSGT